MPNPDPLGLAGRIARSFIDSKLTPLFVIASVAVGAAAILLLPREEEPQIKVPMIDVIVGMPGFSAKEVEERATRPMENLLWEIPGVEYLYSTSRPGESLVIVRFKVGEEIERSLVKLNQKLQSNFDRIPPGVSFPIIKPRSIDDVPILALTLHSSRYDHLMLRRLAAQLQDEIKQVPLVAETALIGGTRNQVRVLLDPTRMALRRLSIDRVAETLQHANRQSTAGTITTDNREIKIETGGFLATREDVGQLVVGVIEGKPVYLRDIATIEETGGEEPSQYVLHGTGAAAKDAREEPAVTITVAKRPGANAIAVARNVLKKIDAARGFFIPADVTVSVTRHYGATAAEKSNELLWHMLIAVAGVSTLILLALGWRESLIVAIAIPATLALTLLVFYLLGFTLNRITLFALIFTIGILVDDAIVVVENIVRHFRLSAGGKSSSSELAVRAVDEVGNPTILATWAVIAAVLPMAFVGGLMGPYMRPIPVGASVAMFVSLLVAFVVTPWAAIRLLHQPSGRKAAEERREDFFTRIYRQTMKRLIERRWSWVFLAAILGLLASAAAFVPLGWVKLKMLPFDNKSEFQIILNMPEGTALERTAQVAREIAAAIRSEPEVVDYQIYAGTAAPFNFNGLVRHYFLRRGGNIADVQVNLAKKHNRSKQSHEIAKRIRPRVTAIAARFGGRVAVAEVPPGPPVLQTLVAEIYGADDAHRLALARQVISIFNQTPGVVDVDWHIEAPQPITRFVIDKEKAALHGISAETISRALRLAVAGEPIDLLHDASENESVNIVLQLPLALRTSPEELLGLRIPTESSDASGGPPKVIPLRELVRMERGTIEPSIYHKNLHPVTYVMADVAGQAESPFYAIAQMNKALRRVDARAFGGSTASLKIFNARLPFSDAEPSLKWDGEWHITLEVFRDLGIAFAAVLLLIYVLMVGWFRSFLTPLVVMAAIPFSLVGILPAHAALHAFFTATSMIGFMAGAGIVVRNSVILVDFIERRIEEGLPLDQAVIEAGAVRFRPMLLTALAVVVGSSVILFDPIFQGLAISLMAGEIASLLISRMAVPVLYVLAAPKRKHPELAPVQFGLANVAPANYGDI